jgi:hypothetical protein
VATVKWHGGHDDETLAEVVASALAGCRRRGSGKVVR